MFNPIMEIDAMQYASMSRELLRGENFLHLFDNGKAYLDKPPMIFWMTALFFKIIGVSEFVYSCLLYTSPSPRDRQKSRMPSSA